MIYREKHILPTSASFSKTFAFLTELPAANKNGDLAILLS